MYDFPNSPTLNQVFGSYTWDGQKWVQTPGLIAATALPLMDGVAAVGTSLLYARQDHVHPSDTSRARLDALAYNGMQINGSMDVSQANGTTAVVNGYVVDGWVVQPGGTMVVSCAQYPNTTQFPGYQNFLGITVGTAEPALGANDYIFMYQHIEGYRIARLQWGTANAQPLSIGFWTAHSKVGTYSVAIRTAPTARSYVTTYVQNVANAAEFKTLTIPGDTAGTWPVNNLTGIELDFTFACGTVASLMTSTPNIWTATGCIAATGQVNAVDSTADVMRITGVVVLPGIDVPSAARAPFIMRPYDQELLTCQRLFQKFLQFTMGAYNDAGGVSYMSWQLAPQMRAVPTIAFANTSYGNASTIGSYIPSNTQFRLSFTTTATGSGYVSTDIALDARL